MSKGKYESFFRTGFREALGNRSEKLADRLVGKTYISGRATSRLGGYRKYAAGQFNPAIKPTERARLRAVGRNYVAGYRAGMRVGRSFISLGRNSWDPAKHPRDWRGRFS